MQISIGMPNKFTLNFKSYGRHFWVTIECLDNPVINRWYQAAKEIYQFPPTANLIHYPIYYSEISIEARDIVNNSYNNILMAIDALQAIGIDWPVVEPTEFNYDQKWCNRVHRYFTTLMQYRKFNLTSNTVIDGDSTNIAVFYKLGHIINEAVHKIEHYCMNQTRQKYLKFNKLLHVNLPGFNYHLNATHKWHGFNQEDYQYHTWGSDYDVIFNAEILGKTILQSFIDEDNPNYFDTSGHNGWWGSFLILTNDSRKRIYDSDDFNNWLADHGVSKESKNIYGDFPIGKVIATSEVDFRRMPYIDNISNCSIEFHD